MRCHFPLLLTIVVSLSVVAAPIPPDDAGAKLKRIYGTWESPKGCSWKFSGEELRVSLPTDRYRMEKKNNGPTGAPRVLREVEGDFTAVVRVSFTIPTGESKVARLNFYGGGLMAQATEQDFVVVRRAAISQISLRESFMTVNRTSGTDASEITFFKEGKQKESAFLRLRREGQKVTTEWSHDQKVWYQQSEIKVTWGTKVKVGIVAENITGAPVDLGFSDYKLTTTAAAKKP